MVREHWPFVRVLFVSDEGPTLKTLDYTIRIGSTPTFLYFDLYLLSNLINSVSLNAKFASESSGIIYKLANTSLETATNRFFKKPSKMVGSGVTPVISLPKSEATFPGTYAVFKSVPVLSSPLVGD